MGFWTKSQNFFKITLLVMTNKLEKICKISMGKDFQFINMKIKY